MRERRDVLRPVAERREDDACLREAEVEVLVEGRRVDPLPKVAPRGREDTNAHGARALRGASRDDFPCFERAQELGLQIGGEIAWVFQQEGPAVGRLEHPRRARLRPCEAPAFTAEQDGACELRRDARAVEDHERTLRARALVVNGARHDLLARTGGSLDENGELGLRDPREPREDGSHPAAGASQRTERRELVLRRSEPRLELDP